MAGSLQWDAKGWFDHDKYLAKVTEKNWQIRYQDDDLIIVRIPADYEHAESWNVFRRLPNCVTNDWWLTVPRSRRPLMYALTEQFGKEFAQAIIEGKPEDDSHAD